MASFQDGEGTHCIRRKTGGMNSSKEQAPLLMNILILRICFIKAKFVTFKLALVKRTILLINIPSNTAN